MSVYHSNGYTFTEKDMARTSPRMFWTGAKTRAWEDVKRLLRLRAVAGAEAARKAAIRPSLPRHDAPRKTSSAASSGDTYRDVTVPYFGGGYGDSGPSCSSDSGSSGSSSDSGGSCGGGGE